MIDWNNTVLLSVPQPHRYIEKNPKCPYQYAIATKLEIPHKVPYLFQASSVQSGPVELHPIPGLSFTDTVIRASYFRHGSSKGRSLDGSLIEDHASKTQTVLGE